MKSDDSQQQNHECLRCGRRISKEEYETYDGMCLECYETEINEEDFES
jgi:NMD protein affecting ribosome stability and mRNA decay